MKYLSTLLLSSFSSLAVSFGPYYTIEVDSSNNIVRPTGFQFQVGTNFALPSYVVTNNATNAVVSGTLNKVATPIGADASGQVDSTLSIQSCFAVTTASNYEVYIPAGTYLISQPIIWSGNFKVRGAGIHQTWLQAATGMTNMMVFGLTNGAYGTLSDLSFEGSSLAGNGMVFGATNGSGVALVSLENVGVYDCTNAGAVLNNSVGVTMKHCSFQRNNDAIQSFPLLSSAIPTTVSLSDWTDLSFNTNRGFYASYFASYFFNNVIVEENGGAGMVFQNTNTAAYPGLGLSLNGVWLESNNLTPALAGLGELVFLASDSVPFYGVSINDCKFHRHNAGEQYIYFGQGYYSVKNLMSTDPYSVLTCSNSTSVDVHIESVEPGQPSLYFGSLAPLANVWWSYHGSGEPEGSESIWVNGGSGTMVRQWNTSTTGTTNYLVTAFPKGIVATYNNANLTNAGYFETQGPIDIRFGENSSIFTPQYLTNSSGFNIYGGTFLQMTAVAGNLYLTDTGGSIQGYAPSSGLFWTGPTMQYSSGTFTNTWNGASQTNSAGFTLDSPTYLQFVGANNIYNYALGGYYQIQSPYTCITNGALLVSSLIGNISGGTNLPSGSPRPSTNTSPARASVRTGSRTGSWWRRGSGSGTGGTRRGRESG